MAVIKFAVDTGTVIVSDLTLREAVDFIKELSNWDDVLVHISEYDVYETNVGWWATADAFYLGVYYFLTDWHDGKEGYEIMSKMNVRIGAFDSIEREEEDGTDVYDVYEFLESHESELW